MEFDHGRKLRFRLKNDKTSLTCAFDSFLTIWLLTLPEKFREWYDAHHANKDKLYTNTKYLNYNENPTFPTFETVDINSTKLFPLDKVTGSFHYLSDTWNLFDCFNHYLKQKDI